MTLFCGDAAVGAVQLLVEQCRFDHFSSMPSCSLEDADADLADAKLRPVASFRNNTFAEAHGPASVVSLALVGNNVGNSSLPRVYLLHDEFVANETDVVAIGADPSDNAVLHGASVFVGRTWRPRCSKWWGQTWRRTRRCCTRCATRSWTTR